MGRGIRFCALVALAAVALRIALFDHVFFALERIPNHDMSEGLAFFATSLHALRIEGDIAWWSPASLAGYAQYYQGFFSPLAPTWGHPVFIVWAQLAWLAARAGLAIPEYRQYLVVNYVVLPWLAFWAYAWFCSLFLKRREAILLAVAAYVLSGIGLWNSAWFYFQEAFSVFLLLGTSVALMQRPTRARLLAWLAAILVQLASLNYWTLYNVFLVAIVLGAYVAIHRNQAVRLVVRLRAMLARDRGAVLALAVFGVTAGAWSALIAWMMSEQSGQYVRWIFTPENVLARVQEVRRYTTELFNPSLERALQGYPVINAMHNARYIGVGLLPLLAAGLIVAGGRRARWLLSSAVLLLAMCIAAPFLVTVWNVIPFMDRIQHLFYFYSHHFQVALVLLAAVGFDVLLGRLPEASRRMAAWIAALGMIFAALTFAATFWTSHEFKGNDPNLQSLLRAALFLGATSLLLFRAMWTRRPVEARLAGWAVVWLLVVDLSVYFYEGNVADAEFTASRSWSGQKPSPQQKARLASPWDPPRPEAGFSAGLEANLPLTNDFWPVNNFMLPSELPRKFAEARALAKHARSSPPILFYAGARLVPDQAVVSDAFLADPDGELRVASASGGPIAAQPSPRVTDGFSARLSRWRYNAFEIEASAPRPGWLMIRQHYDPHWRVTLDGVAVSPVKANYVSMALPVSAGAHALRFEYRPGSRRFYWPAGALLEAALVVLLVLARKGAAQASSRTRSSALA